VIDVSLKSILAVIQKELTRKDEVVEEFHRSTRKATRLSKQAIRFVHMERNEDSKKSLLEADKLFARLKEVAKDYPHLIYTGMMEAALQEYAEGQIFLNLINEGRFVKPEEICVPSIPYVLGLADVIGELRRRTLDSFRRGQVKTGEICLQTMEQIFGEMTAMEEGYLLVPGLRRKCDIARRIIETTRGDVTFEVRRSSLEKSIKELEKAVSETKVGKA
jgi:translin